MALSVVCMAAATLRLAAGWCTALTRLPAATACLPAVRRFVDVHLTLDSLLGDPSATVICYESGADDSAYGSSSAGPYTGSGSEDAEPEDANEEHEEAQEAEEAAAEVKEEEAEEDADGPSAADALYCAAAAAAEDLLTAHRLSAGAMPVASTSQLSVPHQLPQQPLLHCSSSSLQQQQAPPQALRLREALDELDWQLIMGSFESDEPGSASGNGGEGWDSSDWSSDLLAQDTTSSSSQVRGWLHASSLAVLHPCPGMMALRGAARKEGLPAAPVRSRAHGRELISCALHTHTPLCRSA